MKSLGQIFGAFVIAMALLGIGTAMAAQGKLHTMVGQVKKIDSAATTVTVIETVGKKEKEVIFHLAPQASITRNGEKVMLADLKVGDHISVHYTDVKGKLTADSISLENRQAEPAHSNGK